MLITLVALTELFYYLPKFVLAAVVINSIIPLIAVDEAMRLYGVKRHDFILWVVAFLGTLFLGVLYGIAVAVLLSLIIVIFESVRPQITVLWRIPGTTIYRAMKQESNGVFIPNVFICRIGSSMYFANASYIKDTLVQYVTDLQDVNPIKYIILEMTPVVSIDSTAVHIIEDVLTEFNSRGVQLAFAMVGNRVERTMKKAGMQEHIGEDWFFPTVHDAVRYCLKHQHGSARSRGVTGEATTQDGAQSEPICFDDIKIQHTNEVGVSNNLHPECTVIFITLAKDVPMIMSAITAHFKSNNVTVHKAEIEPLSEEGAKHTYFVKSNKTGQQLVDHETDRLREELGALMERHQGKDSLVEGPNSGANRVQELERRLRAQDAKLDRLTELLSGGNGSAEEARQRCFPVTVTCLPKALA
jgi:hypothetical protein